jgi:hypothetical protein
MSVDQARSLLQVGAQASAEELARAWRREVKATHPDAGGTAERFGEVTAAYELLKAATRTASQAEPLAGGKPAMSVVWWLATTATATATAVLVILLLAGSGGIAAAPLAVYTLGAAGFAWWHSAGRPASPRMSPRRMYRRMIPGQRAKG